MFLVAGLIQKPFPFFHDGAGINLIQIRQRHQHTQVGGIHIHLAIPVYRQQVIHPGHRRRPDLVRVGSGEYGFQLEFTAIDDGGIEPADQQQFVHRIQRAVLGPVRRLFQRIGVVRLRAMDPGLVIRVDPVLKRIDQFRPVFLGNAVHDQDPFPILFGQPVHVAPGRFRLQGQVHDALTQRNVDSHQRQSVGQPARILKPGIIRIIGFFLLGGTDIRTALQQHLGHVQPRTGHVIGFQPFARIRRQARLQVGIKSHRGNQDGEQADHPQHHDQGRSAQAGRKGYCHDNTPTGIPTRRLTVNGASPSSSGSSVKVISTTVGNRLVCSHTSNQSITPSLSS